MRLSAPALREAAFRHDSSALVTEIRRRPADARELFALLLEEAARSGARSDSVLDAARSVAGGFAAVFGDAYLLSALRRFEAMSPSERRRKIAADSVRLAGNAALDRRGPEAAIALWRSAAARSTAVHDTAGAAASIGNIGAGFYRTSALDSADVYLKKSKALAEAIGDWRTALNALSVLGSIAGDRGELRQAEALYSEALSRRGAIGDVNGAAADHTNLGLIASELGDESSARIHYLEALRIARSNDLAEATATVLLNLANLSMASGEYREARAQYTEALALYRSIDDDADVALTLHNLGLLALRRGDFAESRARLTDALALFTKAGDAEDLVQVRRDLASVAAGAGDMQTALTQLRRAETHLPAVADRAAAAAGIALTRGDIAWQLNTFDEADRQYARAQQLYRESHDVAGEAEARQGRAMLLVQRRQYTAALGQLNVVLQIQRAGADRRPPALTQISIGVAQRKSGAFDQARRSLTQAIDTLQALGDAVGVAEALAALGDLSGETRAPLAAEEFYRQGLARVASRRVPTIQWQLHAGLGRALRSRGATAEAAVELRAAIDNVEMLAAAVPLAERRAAFLADKWQPYMELALLENARGNTDAAFLLSERMRSRQLLDVLARGRVAATEATDTVLVERGQDLRARIDELTRELEARSGASGPLRGPDLTDTTSVVTREALASAQAEYAQLLLDVSDERGLGAMMRATTASGAELRKRLRADQAMVAYLVGDATTLAFIVTRDSVRSIDLGVGRGELAALVDFVRGTLARPSQGSSAPAWRAPLQRLHQQLIAPVETSRLLDGVRELVIVPNAELNYLPFAALMRERRGDRGGGGDDEFLVERYDIRYTPSASAWVRMTAKASSNNRVLALAPRIAELPGSRQEVEAVRSLYGRDATVLTGSRATERALRDSAGAFGVIHLATYGVLNQHNPLFSFVDLARTPDTDGRLEVHEVLGMKLNARLLVLSACQTGLASGAVSDVPAGDDWVGLVRAFLSAGAQNVIATLWAVEDRSTARIMEQLHRRLRDGQSESAALSQAQREMLRNPATSSPFYWAGFVLVGGPSSQGI